MTVYLSPNRWPSTKRFNYIDLSTVEYYRSISPTSYRLVNPCFLPFVDFIIRIKLHPERYEGQRVARAMELANERVRLKRARN